MLPQMGVSGVTIIGRRDELAELKSFVSEVAGSSRALLLEGEAGVGKTTLWDACREAGRSAGQLVLVARPSEVEATLAFAGLSDLFGQSCQEVLPALPGLQRRAFESALLLADQPEPTDERAVGAATLAVLRVLSERAPVLVAIDDLQWLDSPSVRALEFAFRRLDAEPVGLVATVRVESYTKRGTTGPLLLPPDRCRHVSVGPFSAGAVFELIRRRLAWDVPRRLLLRLHELSGGNPFFAHELARWTLQTRGGSPAVDDLDVPPALHEVLRARLAMLSPETKRVLLVAAAVATPTVELLEAAEPDLDVVAALHEAVEAEIAAVEAGRARFAHPLLARTLYDEASPRARRDLHARLAQVMTHPEERARHRGLSVEGRDEKVAADLAAAARLAEARGALTAAAELAAKAVALTPDQAPAAQQRRLAAARYAFAAGDADRARQLLEATIESTAPGEQRAEALRELSRILFSADDLRPAVEMLFLAAAEAGSNSALRARILLNVDAIGYWGGGYEVALQHARESLAVAEGLTDDLLLADALVAVAEAELAVGLQFDRAVLERAQELAARAGDTRIIEGTKFRCCAILVERRELDGVREQLEGLCALGRRRDDVAVCAVLRQLCELELAQGDWDSAWNAILEAEQIAAQAGRDAYACGLRGIVAYVEAMRGELESARRRAVESLAETEARGRLSGAPLYALGVIALAEERYEEAYEHLSLALERQRTRGVRVPWEGTIAAVEALVALDRVDEAEQFLNEFAEVGDRLGIAWAGAEALRCRGLVASARGDLVAAEEALVAAVGAWEQVGFPFELARASLGLGEVQRRLGRKRAAREALERAISLFTPLPAPVWAARARAEAARIGGRVGSQGTLSGTEDSIAALIDLGKSNREIGEALHLSPRTVEWNLSRIYRKLGVRSRTELAAVRADRA